MNANPNCIECSGDGEIITWENHGPEVDPEIHRVCDCVIRRERKIDKKEKRRRLQSLRSRRGF